MSVYLEIVWDGQVQGLESKRLSLDAFGPALHELLAAIRRIASDLERQATGPSRGRLAKAAANIDVQIEDIQSNSPVKLRCAVLDVEPPTRPLIADLPEQAVEAFLTDVEKEARGAPAHFMVRKFLKALPEGLAQQEYVLRVGDAVRRTVSVGAMAITTPRPAPHLIEVDGIVVGVGFEEGRSEVKIRAHSGELVTFAATREQVDAALALRLQSVLAFGVTDGPRNRLLRVSHAAPQPPSESDRTEYVFSTWRDLLNLLAQ